MSFCRHNRSDDSSKPNKANGYHRNLYRNDHKGRVAGVCAGFADYFDVPTWVARLVFVTLVIFTFQMAIIAYIIAIFMLEKRSEASRRDRSKEDTARDTRYAASPGTRLQGIRDRLNSLDQKVAVMERYVTSKKYHTNNQFNDL
ncbi:MAG: envelope stress response membrane protein PspC [Pseudomonadales bacterium]